MFGMTTAPLGMMHSPIVTSSAALRQKNTIAVVQCHSKPHLHYKGKHCFPGEYISNKEKFIS